MEALVKIDLEKALGSDPVILELGCGRYKKAGAIGIDKVDLPGVDIVADIEDGLDFIPDGSVDEIYALSCFEHIRDFGKLMGEILRVLKKNGRTFVFVPHFSNPYYYSDPTHVRFFGLYSFYYFVGMNYQLRRKVPDYYFDRKIRIVSQRLVFDSPFLFRKIIKRVMGVVLNSCSFLQEFYEENLCYLFPCFGIEVVFTKDE